MTDPRIMGLIGEARGPERTASALRGLAVLERTAGGAGSTAVGGGVAVSGDVVSGTLPGALSSVTTGAPQWGRLGIGVAAPATTGDIRSSRLGLGMDPNHFLDMTVSEAAGDTATPKKGISLIQTFNDNATFPVSAGVHLTFLWENETAVAPGANFPGLRATTYRGGYTGTALAGGTTHAVTAEHVITGVKDDGSGDGLGSTVQECAIYYGTMVDRTTGTMTTTDLWAFDNKLHSTRSSHQNQYIIGYSQLVNQYNATSPATFNTAGAGSNAAQLVTSPRGIADAGFTAGISTYPVDFGLIISGVSGLLANVNNSSATRGFNTALSIGDGTTTWSPHPSRFGTGISVTSWDNSGVGIKIWKRWAGTTTPALSLGWDEDGLESTDVGDGIAFGTDVRLWRQSTDSLGVQTGDMFLAGGFQVTGNSATRGFINFIEQTTDPITGVAAGAARLYAINDGTDTVLRYVDSAANIHDWGSGTPTAVVNITAAASPTKTPIATGHATGLAQNQTLIHTNGEIFLGDGVVTPVHTGRITSYTKDPTGTVDPGTTTDSYYPIFGRHFTPAATYLTGSARTAHFIGYHAAEGSAGGANDYPSLGNVGVWSQMFVGLLTNGSTTTEALGTCHSQTMDMILHRIGDRHAYEDSATGVNYVYDNEYAIARWRFVDDTSKTAYNAGDTRHGRMWGLDFTMHGAPDDTNAPEQFQGFSMLANYYCVADPTVSNSALISGQTWPSLRENTTNHAAHTGRTYPLQVGIQLAGKSGSDDGPTWSIEDYGFKIGLKVGGVGTSWNAVTKSIIHTGIEVADWGQYGIRIGARYTGAAESNAAALSFVADTVAAGGIAFGTDTNLYRQAANRLRTDDAFGIAQTLPSGTLAGNGFYWGADGIAEQLRIGTTGTFYRYYAAATDTTTSPVYRMRYATGNVMLEWGPGAGTAPDTNLYRSAADTLRTDDALYVGGVATLAGAVAANAGLTTTTLTATGMVTVQSLVSNGTAGAGFLAFGEQSSAPATPPTAYARIYAEDNGSGKTKVMAKFDDGSTAQIAIQP